MIFTSPLWWWALAALVVPLVIHLFSRGRRRRVKVGSVRHLSGTESRALRRLRPTGWLQLLLRALLLAALAAALTGPCWQARERAGEGSTWVLIDPELVAAGDSRPLGTALGSRLETAVEKADSVRLLAPGLPTADEALSLVPGPIDAWSLLREADMLAPSGIRFLVFTLDRAELLRGRRPRLARPVEWEVLADPEPNRWLQRVVVRHDQTIEVTVGDSRAGGTRFATHRWNRADAPPPELSLWLDEESGTLGLATLDRYGRDDQVELPERSSPLRLAFVVGEERQGDARYLRLAARAVGEFLGREVEIVEEDSGPVDLEVRLGDMTVRSESSGVVLADLEKPWQGCEGRAVATSLAADRPIRIARCAAAGPEAEEAVWWADGWGRPFLALDAATSTYRLRGRFDPRWSDLVAGPVLPRLLLTLLAPDADVAGGTGTPLSDRRATTGQERLPLVADPAVRSVGPQNAFPEQLAWALVVLLLVVDRLWWGRAS
jgi:hypothetical protein